MARKKQEIRLQVEIETQEEWEEMLGREGVTIVDIYQEWCGPCKAMISNFRRLKNELGDDFLRFAVAKADTIDALEKYRGRCQPCFLFFAGGKLVGLQRGIDTPLISRMVHDQVAQELKVLKGEAHRVEGGVLVAVVRNLNSPLLIKTIRQQLEAEHKVAEGQVERKEISDPLLASFEGDKDDEEEEEDSEEEEPADDHKKEGSTDDLSWKHGGERVIFDSLPESAKKGWKHGGERVIFDSLPESAKKGRKKGVTVAILKPNVVAEGKVDEVKEKMKAAGIEILEDQERQLTEDEARDFYKDRKDEDYFEELVKFMASGPSHVLVLTKGETGEGIIEEWRELLGPPSVEDAKQHAPNSLRALYGKESYVNALHGSDSKETSSSELAFFFPDFVVPTVPGKKKMKVQRTLALIRPDTMRDKKDEILNKIKESGFTIAMEKEIQLTKEQAEEFYQEHREQQYFEELTTRMSKGPLLALALAREDAVTGWRDLLGPKEVDKAMEEAPQSLRAQYSVEGDIINPLHGSDSEHAARQELEFFFPVQQTVAAIKPDAYQTKDEIMQRIREAGFHIAARKETEVTRDIAEQFYGEHKDKEYFSDLTEHMSSGKTLFMVLSREDAVDGWRSLIGPTDPEKAKDEAPDTLRALYGKDIKANAIHGSSNPDHVQKSINLIFGDLQFNLDGSCVEGSDLEEQTKKTDDDQDKEQSSDTESGKKDKISEDNDREDQDTETKGDGRDTESIKSTKGGAESTKGDDNDTKSTKGDNEDTESTKGDDNDTKSTKGDNKDTESTKGDDNDTKSTKGDNKDTESTKGDDNDTQSTKGDDKKSTHGDNKDKESTTGDNKDNESTTGDNKDKESTTGDDHDKESTKGGGKDKESITGDDKEGKGDEQKQDDDKDKNDKTDEEKTQTNQEDETKKGDETKDEEKTEGDAEDKKA